MDRSVILRIKFSYDFCFISNMHENMPFKHVRGMFQQFTEK